MLADAAHTGDHPRHEAALEAYREFRVQYTGTDPDAAPMLAALRERGLKLRVPSSTRGRGRGTRTSSGATACCNGVIQRLADLPELLAGW